MALLESIIKRSNGTRVTFGGGAVVYHFKPDSTGAHVAEVGNVEHVERLLSIKPQAYRAVETASKPKNDDPVTETEIVDHEAEQDDNEATEEAVETASIEPEPDPATEEDPDPEPAPAPKKRKPRARAKPRD